MVKSHPEDRRYLYRFHACSEILMCLYEIFKKGKKQDLTLIMIFAYKNATYASFVSLIPD